MNRSLGLIEVIGYVAAVEAADAALKAANVRLIGIEKISAGIVTVKITGDVGAVKSSIEAAVASAEKIGVVRTSHVIPRVDNEVLKIIYGIKDAKQKSKLKEKTDEVLVKLEDITHKEDIVEEVKIQIEDIENVESNKCEECTEVLIDENKKDLLLDITEKEKIHNLDNKKINSKSLSKMSVTEVRKLAVSLELPITSKEIKSMKKEDLIEALLNFNGEGES